MLQTTLYTDRLVCVIYNRFILSYLLQTVLNSRLRVTTIWVTCFHRHVSCEFSGGNWQLTYAWKVRLCGRKKFVLMLKEQRTSLPCQLSIVLHSVSSSWEIYGRDEFHPHCNKHSYWIQSVTFNYRVKSTWVSNLYVTRDQQCHNFYR